MDNIVVAFDQSTTNTGWAVFINGVLVDHGCYSPSGDIEVRILKTRDFCTNLVYTYRSRGSDTYTELNKENVIVLIEEIQLQQIKNTSKDIGVTTFKKLAWLQGTLITAFLDCNAIYQIIPSTSWKGKLKIKGKERAEQKRNATQFIENNYDLKVGQDTVDAICIGLYFVMEQDKSIKVKYNEVSAGLPPTETKMF